MNVSWYRRAPLLWLLALCAIVALYGAHAGRSWSFTVDDAAITYSYARNLAQGHGLVLNVGGERVEGATNFLWTLMLAPAGALGVSHEGLSKWLGVTFGALALVAIATLPSAMRARPPRYFDLCAPLICALMPNYTIWTVSGLENGLCAALLAAALHALAREERDEERFPWSSVFLYLLFLTRPDGALFSFAVGAAKLLRKIKPSRPRRQDVLWVLTLAVGVFAIELFRLAYFAWPFPNTFYAKTRGFGLRDALLNLRSDGWAYLGGWLWLYKLLIPSWLALGAFFGPKPHATRLAMLACTGIAMIFPVATQGDWMGEYRFLTNASLLLSLAMCEGARSVFVLLSRLTPRAARPAARWLATPLLAIAVLGLCLRFYPHRYEAALQHNTITMQTVATRLPYFIEVKRRLGLPTRPTLLETDIGAPSYDQRFFIYDLVGLADVATARNHPHNPPGLREAVFGEYQPDFVRLHGPFFVAFEFPRLEEISSLYFGLPNELNGQIDGDAHYVRRALISAPYQVGARRLAAAVAGAPDAVTVSHRFLSPGRSLMVDVLLTDVPTVGSTWVTMLDDRGVIADRVGLDPLGGVIQRSALFAGERLRARARFEVRTPGHFRLFWSGPQGAATLLGELDVRADGSAADVRELRSALESALREDRFDLAWNVARVLTLKLATQQDDAIARPVLDRFAQALAERARTAADARGYAIAAAIARQARALAPLDRRTLSLCGEVAERLADAARDDEGAGRIEAAFERARDAVLVDPRRSWARRRAETLRPRRMEQYDGGQALAAYQAAAEAMHQGDTEHLDRAIVFMGGARQWLEAARLAEHAAHTPRDPDARIIVARGLLEQGRAREALGLASGVPCREARDPALTVALRAIVGAQAYRPADAACVEPSAPVRVTFDDRVGSFESDRWAPWTATGDAWSSRPDALRRCTYWMNGYRGRAFANSVRGCAVSRRGVLQSPSFTIEHEGLSFLVAGGVDAMETGVRLVLDGHGGRVALRAAGQGHDGMKRVYWDLRALHGERAHIEIYDHATRGEFGYVLADDVREEPVIPDGVASAVAAAP